MPMFKHTPLDTTRRQIRLFQLLPHDGPTKRPRGTIQHVDMADCPPYIALSYEWGPATPNSPISVDGKAFLIRANLWHRNNGRDDFQFIHHCACRYKREYQPSPTFRVRGAIATPMTPRINPHKTFISQRNHQGNRKEHFHSFICSQDSAHDILTQLLRFSISALLCQHTLRPAYVCAHRIAVHTKYTQPRLHQRRNIYNGHNVQWPWSPVHYLNLSANLLHFIAGKKVLNRSTFCISPTILPNTRFQSDSNVQT